MRLSRALAAGAAALAVALPAAAAPYTWTGGGASASWGDPLNWDVGSPPPDDGTADVTFATSLASGATVTLDGARYIHGLSITSAANLTLAPGAGGSLRLAGGQVQRSSGATATFTAPLVGVGGLAFSGSAAQLLMLGGQRFALGAPAVCSGPASVSNASLALAGGPTRLPQGWPLTVGAGAWLDLAGNEATVGALAGPGAVTNSASTPATLVIGTDGTDATFSGNLGQVYTDQVLGHSLGLLKLGPGTQTLSGSSSLTGQVRVEAGLLRVTGSLPSGGSVLLVSGGTHAGALAGSGSVGAIRCATTAGPGGSVAPSLGGGASVLQAASADLSGCNLQLHIGGAQGAGVDWDQLNLGLGGLTLDARSTLVLDLQGLTAPGGPWAVVRCTGAPAQPFGEVRLINNPQGYQAAVSYGLTGVSVTLSVGTPAAGFAVAPDRGLVTSEAGRSATFTVALTQAPLAPVQLSLASTNPGEGTVQPASLTFDGANWATPQTVTVTGVDDALPDGNQAYAITFAAAQSADPAYQGRRPPDVAVTNLDDDLIQVSPVAGLVTNEAGLTAQFQVVLGAQPAQPVVLRLTSTAPTQGEPDPAQLTFGAGDWSAPQLVTVRPFDDGLPGPDVDFQLTFEPAQSADPLFDGAQAPSVAVTNLDLEGDRAPVAAPDAYATLQGTALRVPAPGVLANDLDPDGDLLLAQLEGAPAHGTLALDGDGGLLYQPDPGYAGPDAFSYRASDRVLLSAPAQVSLSVAALRTPLLLVPGDGGWVGTARVPVLGAGDEAVQLEARVDGGLWSTTSDADGGFAVVVGPLADGPWVATVVERDPLGFASAPAQVAFTVDTTPPGAPLLTAPDAGAVVVAPFDVQGTAEPESAVEVRGNGALLGSAQAQAGGQFALTVASASPGPLLLTARATDRAGNASPDSAPLAITVSPASSSTSSSSTSAGSTGASTSTATASTAGAGSSGLGSSSAASTASTGGSGSLGSTGSTGSSASSAATSSSTSDSTATAGSSTGGPSTATGTSGFASAAGATSGAGSTEAATSSSSSTGSTAGASGSSASGSTGPAHGRTPYSPRVACGCDAGAGPAALWLGPLLARALRARRRRLSPRP